MQENTNKAIAYNSIILYGRMALTTICVLLTTRFALKALGVVDYGLFAVLGSIISFIGIFNTIMVTTSNRFIAVAIGKGDINEANKQFNVNLIVHVGIAFLVLLIAYPIGNWYIPQYVNYNGPIENAMMVYLISIIGSVLSFIGVPYNGLLMAKEKFLVFSLVDVVIHIVKLIIAWLLIYFIEHKLFIYTLTMSLLTAASTAVYFIYCKHYYSNIVKFRIVRDRKLYKNVFSFSAWISVGAVTFVGRNQGAALIVNAFFDTIMNAAMGVASSINAYVGQFAQIIMQPIAPQITKSYAAGNMARTDELLIMSVKYTFMLTFLVGSLLLVAPEWLLGLWLGEVPPYASVFLVLLVIDNLIGALNGGVSNLLAASGKIELYQILTGILRILSIIVAYFVLRSGAPAYYLTVVYIIFSIIMFFAIQWTLHYVLNYDNGKLWKRAFIPLLGIVIMFIPAFFLPSTIPPAIKILISMIYLCLLEWYIGFSKVERMSLKNFVRSKIKVNSYKRLSLSHLWVIIFLFFLFFYSPSWVMKE